jgi:endonuclease YncB( thermonuclease family)
MHARALTFAIVVAAVCAPQFGTASTSNAIGIYQKSDCIGPNGDSLVIHLRVFGAAACPLDYHEGVFCLLYDGRILDVTSDQDCTRHEGTVVSRLGNGKGMFCRFDDVDRLYEVKSRAECSERGGRIEIRPFRVINGNTISVGEERIRILNANAPATENNARCNADGRLAARATRTLTNLIAGKPLQFERLGEDRFGRTLAYVRIRGFDVGNALINEGVAVRSGTDWCMSR